MSQSSNFDSFRRKSIGVVFFPSLSPYAYDIGICKSHPCLFPTMKSSQSHCAALLTFESIRQNCQLGCNCYLIVFLCWIRFHLSDLDGLRSRNTSIQLQMAFTTEHSTIVLDMIFCKYLSFFEFSCIESLLDQTNKFSIFVSSIDLHCFCIVLIDHVFIQPLGYVFHSQYRNFYESFHLFCSKRFILFLVRHKARFNEFTFVNSVPVCWIKVNRVA